VYSQFRWSIKHLPAHIALVPYLSLRSFPNSYLFFSFFYSLFFVFFLYLKMIRLETILLIIRNPQTQHQIWFFFFSRNLQNRPPRVHRSFRMWTLSSRGSIRIRTRDFRGEEEVDAYGAHVLFLCDQKGGGEKKKDARKEDEKFGSLFKKKKQSKNLKKEPVGFLFFVG